MRRRKIGLWKENGGLLPFWGSCGGANKKKKDANLAARIFYAKNPFLFCTKYVRVVKKIRREQRCHVVIPPAALLADRWPAQRSTQSVGGSKP